MELVSDAAGGLTAGRTKPKYETLDDPADGESDSSDGANSNPEDNEKARSRSSQPFQVDDGVTPGGPSAKKSKFGVPDLTSSLKLRAPFLILIYLLCGTTLFVLSEKWSFVDSLYFCIVTLTTVGYGDMSPDGPWNRIVLVFYLYVGIAFVSAAVGQVVGSTLTESKTQPKYYLLPKRLFGAGKYNCAVSRNYAEVFHALLTVAFLGTIGTTFYCWNEDMTFIDGFYFSMITLAAVGYGDIDQSRETTKLFDIFFIIIGVALVASCMAKIAEAYARSELEAKIKKFVDRGVTKEVVQEMDVDNSGSVERIEFLSVMLVRMGKCAAEDITGVLDIFDKLDADGSGVLDVDDIKVSQPIDGELGATNS